LGATAKGPAEAESKFLAEGRGERDRETERERGRSGRLRQLASGRLIRDIRFSCVPRSVVITIEISVRRGDDGHGGAGEEERRRGGEAREQGSRGVGTNNRDESLAGGIASGGELLPARRGDAAGDAREGRVGRIGVWLCSQINN